MSGLTIGSLFTGAGMLDRAVEEVFGARTAWVSEIDPGACKVLAHRFPDVPNLGDITTIDWSTVEPVDIIAGGSPCQDLSSAGRRAGMTDGTRSNLWVQMREAIAHVQPAFVVWENVRGAFSAHASSDLEHCPGCMGDPADRGPVLRALGRVLGDLSDLGYDTQWHGLRAADVGACHGRFRVFVLAYARGRGGHEALEHDGRRAAAGDRASVPHERGRVALRPGPERADGLTLLPTPVVNDMGEGKTPQAWDEMLTHWKTKNGNVKGHGKSLAIEVQRLLPTPTSNIGQNGGPQHPDKRRAGGHSVSIEDAVHGLALLPTPRATRGGSTTETSQLLLPTPSVADSMGGHERRGGARGGELLLKGIAKYLLPTPTTEPMTGNGHARNLGAEVKRWGDYAAAIARHEQALGRPAPAPTEPDPNGNPRLSARFEEWMMMLPAGWITDVPGVTRNEAVRMLGNGVVPPQAVAALRDMKQHITPLEPACTQETTA